MKVRGLRAEENPIDPEWVHSASALEKLTSVPGLDLAHGLAAFDGHVETYLTLLRRFIVDHRKDPGRISAYLSAGELDAASLLTHALTGVAGKLGAVDLERTSAHLEALLHGASSPDTSLSQELIDRMERDLDTLATSLPSIGERPALVSVEAPFDPSDVKSLIEELAVLLRTFDTGSRTLCKTHSGLLQQALGEQRFGRLMTCLEAFDFDAALEILEYEDSEG